MPDSFLVAPNPATGGVTLVASTDRPFSGGPYPGAINFLLTVTFEGFTFGTTPNVVASTGNPHWTVHPIWVNPAGAGFVVNRKTESPGGQAFNAYFLFMGVAPALKAEGAKLALRVEEVDEEKFSRRAGSGIHA